MDETTSTTEAADSTTNTAGTGSTAGLRATLSDLRADPRRRRVAAVLGAFVGLAVAQFTWLGFLLGGALVGLAAPGFRRALAYGLVFGLVGVALFAAVLLQAGVLGAYAATGQLFYVGLAVPVVGGLVGSLVRGIV